MTSHRLTDRIREEQVAAARDGCGRGTRISARGSSRPANGESSSQGAMAAQAERAEAKFGLNGRCRCASGLKYKHCHGLPGRWRGVLLDNGLPAQIAGSREDRMGPIPLVELG